VAKPVLPSHNRLQYLGHRPLAYTLWHPAGDLDGPPNIRICSEFGFEHVRIEFVLHGHVVGRMSQSNKGDRLLLVARQSHDGDLGRPDPLDPGPS
jgi:hypothetical protein